MSITTTAPATLEDLMQVEGKAELIAGRIVRFMASGYHYSAAFVIVYPETLCGECGLSYLT